MKNLKACFPQKSSGEIDRLTRSSLQHTACLAFEMGKAWLCPMEKVFSLIKAVDGMEPYKAALAEGRGLILLAPHLGNWEIFGQYVCSGVDSTFMYQPPKLPALDKLLKETRSRNGIKLAPTNIKGVAKLIRALDRGGLAGLLPDQVPTAEGGAYANFFAEPAWTMTLVSKLIARAQPRVFFGYAKRLKGSSGFKIVITEADEEIYSKDQQESLTGLNRSVERCVLDCVDQYQWEYKRFRKRPDGTKFY